MQREAKKELQTGIGTKIATEIKITTESEQIGT